MFATTLTVTPRVISSPGEKEKPVRKARKDKKGNRVVEVVGKENIAGYINSFADSVDINLIMARFTSGEKEALLRKKALFIDTTDLPEDYFGYVNKINEVKEEFVTLPPNIKAKFDYDADKYVGEIISNKDSWFNKLTGKDTLTTKDDIDVKKDDVPIMKKDDVDNVKKKEEVVNE